MRQTSTTLENTLEGKARHGVVEEYNATKGYGFIRTDDGNSLFVHSSSINRPGFRALRKDEQVTFEISEEKGLQAINVYLE